MTFGHLLVVLAIEVIRSKPMLWIGRGIFSFCDGIQQGNSFVKCILKHKIVMQIMLIFDEFKRKHFAIALGYVISSWSLMEKISEALVVTETAYLYIS